jgi:hypothetical protein
MKQPDVFGIKFLTGLCLSLQLTHLVPEEMSAFFDGELVFPEDTVADEIEALDQIMYSLPILSEEYLEDFKA